jgi:hypothetical protein
VIGVTVVDGVHRKVLTGTEMDRIKAAASVSWVSAVVETFLCFGVDLTDPAQPRVRTWSYAIPSDQWKEIGQACLDSPIDPGSIVDGIARVNHLLDWGNYGPSSYERSIPDA